jgi:chemotaxis protein methyltransferase CheR
MLLHAMAQFPFETLDDFIEWILSAPLKRKQIELLASYLTVQETYFFRDAKTFQAMERAALPDLIKSRAAEKRIRVWSAGCSTGEEIYSIAILLDRLLPDIESWNITLLATDINPRALEAAREAVYSEWSFRETPAAIRDKYFEKVSPKRFALALSIKSLATFSYLNLSDESYPSVTTNTNAMDIIFCRNVLMYFSPETAQPVMNRFRKCLTDRGFLIVGAVEAPVLPSEYFAPVRFDEGTVFHRKREGNDHGHKQPVELSRRGDHPRFDPAPLADITMSPVISTSSRTGRKREERKKLPDEREGLEKAALCFDRGLYEEAAAELQRVLARDKGNVKAMTLLSRSLANQGGLEEARRWCEKALGIEKTNPCLYYLLAMILQEQKRTDEAIVALNRALYLDPDFVPAHFALGNLAMKSRKTTASRRHFRNAAEILTGYGPEDIVPESGGMAAGKLREIISAIGP